MLVSGILVNWVRLVNATSNLQRTLIESVKNGDFTHRVIKASDVLDNWLDAIHECDLGLAVNSNWNGKDQRLYASYEQL